MADETRTDRRVEREAMDAVAGGVDHHGRGAVDDVTGRDLPQAGLQDIGEGRAGARVRVAAQDREDRADADVDIDIAEPSSGSKTTTYSP